MVYLLIEIYGDVLCINVYFLVKLERKCFKDEDLLLFRKFSMSVCVWNSF